jgi:hypothetical protein
MSKKLSRRDFLKLASATSAGLALSACGATPTELPTATFVAPTATFAPTNTPQPSVLNIAWASNKETLQVDQKILFPLVGGINHLNRYALDVNLGTMKLVVLQSHNLTQVSNQQELRQSISLQLDSNAEFKEQALSVSSTIAEMEKFKEEKDFGNLILIAEESTVIGAVSRFGGNLNRYSVNREGTTIRLAQEPNLLPELRVSGSKIERVDNPSEFIQFIGVNIENFDFSDLIGMRPTFDDTKRLVDISKAWRSNLLRFQISTSVALRHYEALEKIIRYAELNGMYVILSPESAFPNAKEIAHDPRDQKTMTKIKEDITELAKNLVLRSNVLYGLLNEPGVWNNQKARDDITWDIWAPVAHDIANSIRNVNPNAILVLSGTYWSRNYSGLTDETFPFDNYICDVHHYATIAAHDGHDMTEEINPSSTWKWLIGQKPILIGEAGAGEGRVTPYHAEYIKKSIQLTNEHPYEVHYAAFAMWSAGQGGDFNLLDWNGSNYSPSKGNGEIWYADMTDPNSRSPAYDFMT